MNIQEMINRAPLIGKIEWIGLRLEKRCPLNVVGVAEITPESGLIGDHYKSSSRQRQLTLIQSEHLDAVAKILGRAAIDPSLTRRNIVISGINLLALKEQQFQIGDEVILETTGACHPCSRMEANLGEGGYHAMVGHGGITAKVVQGGKIHLGDAIRLVPKTQLIDTVEK